MTNELSLGAEGIDYLTRAYELSQPDDPLKVHILKNIAHIHEIHYQMLRKRGRLQEAEAHLSKAIFYATEAVNVTAEDHVELGDAQKNLAAILSIRLRDFGEDMETRKLVKYYWLAAAENIRAHPLVRIPAMMYAGAFYWQDGELAEADQLLCRAVDLTLQLNPQQMSTEDLRQTLRAVSGVASTATSVALAAGRSGTHALQILGGAHCIVAGLFVDQKSDISQLRAADPALAQRLEDVRTKLSCLSKQQQKSAEFFEMVTSQDSLLSELSATEALVLPLPNLNHSDLKKLSLFNDSGNTARRNVVPRHQTARKGNVDEVLVWLWKTAVKPILDATELTSSRRIWWITTGLAGHAPLHAAGYHTEDSTENTMSRVISSYVSSFKVLRFNRGRATSAALDNMLLVSASSHPPPFRDINADLEIKVAKEIFGDALMHIAQPEPGIVLKNIPNYSIAHFACHGFARINDPSSNGLVLVKDGNAVTLTVSDIEKVDHKAGAIAYLSACSTAEQSDMKLMDEAIHLANSFQIAGYQHFLQEAPSGRDGNNEENKTLDVAKALHEAIIEYKNGGKDRRSVLEWGPFIHVGT
ncbi:CHAT domain-containing protein [Annulohypoxylon bovei var. microspora]|nr:CHAT domain-containing protein [Annulohypoxylon bovei var. microspora]